MSGRNALSPHLRPTNLEMDDRLELELNDIDNGKRLLSQYGQDLVFVIGKGWAVWDGVRYSFRGGELAAREVCYKLRDLVLEEANYLHHNFKAKEDDVLEFMEACLRKRPPLFLRTQEDALKAMGFAASAKLRAHATKCGNVSKIETSMKTIEHQRRAEVVDMDMDAWAFVCPNGQLDLRAIKDWEKPVDADVDEIIKSKADWIKPINRATLPTKCAGVDYDASATAPAWDAFMELIVPDQDIRECVQRCLGMTLFGENRAQVCLILRGGGGNGKSTLLNTLSHVLGQKDGYAAPCKIEMFLETGHAQSGGATPDEVILPGARAYIATEPGARDILSAKKVKGLTGGDRRISRDNYGSFFEWKPNGIPLLSVNRTPKIKDEDEGTRRRLIFIPFDVNLRALPVEKQRSQGEVEAELRAEGAGVLNWLIAGFQAFMDRGIDPPKAMQDLKEKLMESADPVGVYVDTLFDKDATGRVNVTDFYKVYERWCDEDGHTLYQPKTVREIMVEKGFETGKVQGRNHWKGVRWNKDAFEIVEQVTGSKPKGGPPIEKDIPF